LKLQLTIRKFNSSQLKFISSRLKFWGLKNKQCNFGRTPNSQNNEYDVVCSRVSKSKVPTMAIFFNRLYYWNILMQYTRRRLILLLNVDRRFQKFELHMKEVDRHSTASIMLNWKEKKNKVTVSSNVSHNENRQRKTFKWK